MRLLTYGEPNFDSSLATFCAASVVSPEIQQSVSQILSDVRSDRDRAVVAYAEKFDRVALAPGDLRVPVGEMAEATRSLAPKDRAAIQAARKNVLEYNRRGLPKNWTAKNPHGAMIGENHYAIRRVGLYVPGGEVPLVSTVIMTATLAQIAGCPEIAVCTPSSSNGEIAAGLLAALYLCGVREVYRVGGVQAIGAMAYGTETIPAVDKIFGPGNAYVCEAKRQVFGTVGVDLLPGPSEVMVIADSSANPEYAAADLLAQAEHGSGREKVYLIATSPAIVSRIEKEVMRQLVDLGRAEKTRKVLENGFLSIVASTPAAMAAVANYVAPEHLELMVAPGTARKLEKLITTAGAILIGDHTPTVLGDFIAGPSHVLPTGRAGRFFSGLRVADFLRRTSIVRYDSASIRKAAPFVAAFSSMEQLDAHGRSAEIRLIKSKATS